MKIFKSTLIVLSLCLSLAFPTFVLAADEPATTDSGSENKSTLLDPFSGACDGNSDSAICNSTNNDFGKVIKTVTDTLLYILGAVSVLTIIVSGIRYTTSHGDASAVAAAKNTLFYAVIGLIVAVSAYAIVSFAADQFWGNDVKDESAKISLTIS